MPRTDLIGPLGDRPSETADIERHGRVGEVTAGPADPLDGEFGVGVLVDLTDYFLSRSSEPHLLARATSAQQPEYSLVLI